MALREKEGRNVFQIRIDILTIAILIILSDMIILVIFWLLAYSTFSLTRIPLEVEGKEYFVNLFTGNPSI